MKWKEVLAEPYSLPLDTVTSVVYEIGEDTLVDNRLCKTIMMNGERLERWIFEEDDRVWILTKDFPDPIMIYDFNWNNESPFCEYLRVNEPSQEVELLKSYLNKDDIKNVIYKNQSIEYILKDDGGMIRHIGRVSDLRRNSCLLGYKIVEPVLPGIEYLKVLWIVRDGQEIFRSETAEEWIFEIPSTIHELPYAALNAPSSCPPYFDLQGRKITVSPQKGVYIRGGRKYVVR